MRRLFALAVLASGLAIAAAHAQTAPGGVVTPRMVPQQPLTRPVTPPPAAAAPSTAKVPAKLYAKEGEAQTACAGDTVVWGNSSSHVYHLAGAPYYGKTKRGGYMCQKVADGSGYHLSKNGS